jgi:hypothetical protein
MGSNVHRTARSSMRESHRLAALFKPEEIARKNCSIPDKGLIDLSGGFVESGRPPAYQSKLLLCNME